MERTGLNDDLTRLPCSLLFTYFVHLFKLSKSFHNVREYF